MSRNKLESYMAQNGHGPCPEKSKEGFYCGSQAMGQ